MKPAPFAYAAPRTLDEALSLLAEHGHEAKPLAGGQSLVPMLNFRLACPALLIDLERVAGLDGVGDGAGRSDGPPDGGGDRAAGAALRLGAMVRQRRLERDPEISRRAPLLARAAPFVAHPQIRNRGTVGGSLAHADPAGELPAVAVAAGARLELASLRGRRWVAADDFFVGLLTTALEPDELLVAVELPPPPPCTGWAFAELARRHGDYAQVGVAARLGLGPDGRCTDAALIFLSVGDGPLAAVGAVAALTGEVPSAAAIAAAAETATGEIDPAGDIHATADYKRHLARVLARRALTAAAAEARAMLAEGR